MRRLLFALAAVPALVAQADAAGYSVTLPCDVRGERISRDGGMIALFCADASGRTVALPSGRLLRAMPPDPTALDAAISDDGSWLAVVEPGGKISAYATAGAAHAAWSVGAVPSTMQFLPNGLLLIDRTLWNVPAARAVTMLPTDFDVLNAVALDAHAGRAATAGADTTVRVYDAKSWKPLYQFRDLLMEPFGVAFMADGSRLAVGGADYRVTVLNAADGRVLRALPPFRNAYISAIEPLPAKDWMAVRLNEPASASPVAWKFVNLVSGETRPVCGANPLARFHGGAAWCYRVRGRQLTVASEPLPHG
jgi:WD40 repeat protein